jgi:hypothetical protein
MRLESGPPDGDYYHDMRLRESILHDLRRIEILTQAVDMTCLESLDPALIRVGMRTRLILKLLEDAL